MAYIGKQPVVGNFQVCDAISVVNGQAAYTMQVGSANVNPENANHMLVSLNGVLQKPGSSFTISGATITFASNLATGDVIDFIILLGNVLDIGTPSDDSVGAAQIKADLISGTTALTAIPATTDELLISDAGTLKRIDAEFFQNTPAFAAAIVSNQSVSDDTSTKAQFASEVLDTHNVYDNSTNYRWTPGVAGKYFLFLRLQIDSEANNNLDTAKARIFKNGSNLDAVASNFGHSEINFNDNTPRETGVVVSIIADLDADDYVEAYGSLEATDGSGGHFGSMSIFLGYKLTGV